jgi:hypothetical protein
MKGKSDPKETLTVVGQPRGKGRAIIKGELGTTLAQLQRLLKRPQLLPKLEDLKR